MVVLPFGMRNPCREFLKYAAENENYRQLAQTSPPKSGDAMSVMQASDPIAKFVTGAAVGRTPYPLVPGIWDWPFTAANLAATYRL